jgi:hypothetical protein
MKRHMALIGLPLTFCALACAQEMTGDHVVVPAGSHPRVIKANISNGSITVRTHPGGDVIIETGDHHHDPHPERTYDGLKRLDLPTRGLEVDADENSINIRLNHEAANSSLEITVPAATSLQLQSSNGAIDVDGVSGECDLSSHNGAIRATNISGTVLADTHNGPIRVTINRVDTGKPIAFTSYNGPIDVTLPADVKANLKLRALQGEVYTDFDVKLTPVAGETLTEKNASGEAKYRLKTSQVINGTINGGGVDASFTTYNGKILIRKK